MHCLTIAVYLAIFYGLYYSFITLQILIIFAFYLLFDYNSIFNAMSLGIGIFDEKDGHRKGHNADDLHNEMLLFCLNLFII